MQKSKKVIRLLTVTLFIGRNENERFSKWNGRISKLMVKQKMICPLCDGKFLNEHIIEVDHIKPVSLGGNDRYENLQAVHDSCHAQKSARKLKFTRQ
jgi:5-methylcytosine-specific restriction endonuclease McrA